MDHPESELDMARRHVAEGERHVLIQEKVIDHLRRIGASTETAEQLQRQFQELLLLHRQHLAKLESRPAAGTP